LIETILKELTAMSVMPYGYLIMPVWGAFWTYFAFWFCSIKIFKDNIFLQLLLIYLGIFTINDALMQESILPNINIYI